MYARVVRFTDVDSDYLAERVAAVEGSEGPPVDPGDTPGTRASIDRCEVKAELGGSSETR